MSSSLATDLYDEVAHETAVIVIRRYSTSFSMATRLLGDGVREDVENIYGLVRVADEIVDGVAEGAGLAPADVRRRLDEFEAETERATASGYSANLIIHAFALTARKTGIGHDLTRPFFSSMRADVLQKKHTPASFDEYVYGSAEVVGLMCLRAFLAGHDITPEQDQRFVAGARALGAAFQKVNFLRDLSADADGLGRAYFPGVDVAHIDADLALSGSIVPELPRSSRRAVALAQSLFAELNRRIEKTPAAVLRTTRISVPNAVKTRLLIRALRGKVT